MAAGSNSLVRDLVDQFDDPFTFYRELIQNSIDAGSNRIDVTLRYKPGRPGHAIIHVEDDGEGMDEHVIDNFLLVLFSSTKENDFTKIGKFGIGFVSVFAPRPEMVRVYTAKNGQSWRIDFPSYKRYEKYKLSAMREGTLVELVKAMPPRDYAGFVERSRKTIDYWCKHSEARIFFRDHSSREPAAPINRPFELPGGVSASLKEEGTEILAGFSAEEQPFYGFYNKGLTLKEDHRAFFPGVTFKVKSRYLEHTLTRDNVMEDENYRKAMALVKRIVDDELPEALRRELVNGAGSLDAVELWRARSPFLKNLLQGFFGEWRHSDWPIFPALSGKPVTLSQLTDAPSGECLYFDGARSHVSDALEARGIPVLREGPWLDLLEAWTKMKRAQASSSFICPSVLKDPPQGSRPFFDAVNAVDRLAGAAYQSILPAQFGPLPEHVEPPFVLAQREPGRPMPVGEREKSSLFGGKRYALLNVEHPAYRELERLHRSKPGLAAFMALKLLHLNDGTVPPEEAKEYFALAQERERRLLSAALDWEAKAP